MASSSQPPPRTSGRVRAPPVRYRSKSFSQPVSAPNKSTVGADTVVEPYSNGGGCPDAAVTHPDVAVDTERCLSWGDSGQADDPTSLVDVHQESANDAGGLVSTTQNLLMTR